MKFHELDKKMTPGKAVKKRQEMIEEKINLKLEHIPHYSFDTEGAVKRNIENMIGCAQLPMGVAGPLKVNGEEVVLPLATTEGALVASVNRGCKAINSSGGAKAHLIQHKMARAPVMRCETVEDAVELVEWVEEHMEEIRKVFTKGETGFLKLLNVKPWIVGRNVFLRFECWSGDAMGMNMITIGSAAACKLIQENTGGKWISTSGNMCVDKKPSALNFIRGRGRKVIAECTLKEKTLKEVLKTDAKSMSEVCYRKNLVGSAQAGSYGFNAHFANIVAAMYIATGQDPAQVVSGSMGFTLAEAKGKDLHVSVTIPCLQLATVGGGTWQGTQAEALKIMGLHGGGDQLGDNADRLSKVIASAVLAGEISLLAALAAKHLSGAHADLGR